MRHRPCDCTPPSVQRGVCHLRVRLSNQPGKACPFCRHQIGIRRGLVVSLRQRLELSAKSSHLGSVPCLGCGQVRSGGGQGPGVPFGNGFAPTPSRSEGVAKNGELLGMGLLFDGERHRSVGFAPPEVGFDGVQLAAAPENLRIVRVADYFLKR